MKRKIFTLLLLIVSMFAVQAHEDNCLYFDGDADLVNFGDIDAIDGTDALTVEMWVKIENWRTWNNFFSKRLNGNSRIQFQLYSSVGKLGIVINPGEYRYTAEQCVYEGEWFHIAMVYDYSRNLEAEKFEVYINGESQGLGSLGGSVPSTTPNNSAPVLLGAEGTEPGTYYGYEGKMDDVRFWSDARSQAEIQTNMYNKHFSGDEEGLISTYNFDQGVGGGDNRDITTLIDQAGNYDGSIDNFTLNGSTSNFVGTTRNSLASVQATDINENRNVAHQIGIDWTHGSGVNRVVFCKEGSTGAAAPVDNTRYNASAQFGQGDQIGTTGWYCVYNGSANAINVIDLEFDTDYRFMVCEYNGAIHYETYNTEATENENVVTIHSIIPYAPELVSNPVDPASITATSMTVSAEITDPHGVVTEQGVVYCIHKDFDPEQVGVKVPSQSLTSPFDVELTGLTEGVTYYYVPYAVNSVGISYGEQQSETPAAETYSSSLVVTGDGIVNHNGINYGVGSHTVLMPSGASVSLTLISDNDRTVLSLTDSETGIINAASGLDTYVYNSTDIEEERTITVAFSTQEYVARIKDVFYMSLETAANEADDDTVYVLKDCSTEDFIIEGKHVGLDGQGFAVKDVLIDNSARIDFIGDVQMNSFLVETTHETTSAQFTVADNLTITSEETWLERQICSPGNFNRVYWYTVSTPFEVNLANGVYRLNRTEQLVNGEDFMFNEYAGQNRADFGIVDERGAQASWQTSTSLQRGTAYMLAVKSAINNVISFKAVAPNEIFNVNKSVPFSKYTGASPNGATDASWNFLAQCSSQNATLSTTNAAGIIQVLRTGGNNQLGESGNPYYEPVSTATAVVGPYTAYMYQPSEAGTMTAVASNSTANVRSAATAASPYFELQLADESGNTDKLFVGGSHDALASSYEVAADVLKAGKESTTRLQMWSNAFGERLCANQGLIVDNEVAIPLSMSVPSAGNYTLSVKALPAEGSLFLQKDGALVQELSDMPYSFSAQASTIDTYSLRIVYPGYTTVTSLEDQEEQEFSAYASKGTIYLNNAEGNISITDIVGNVIYTGSSDQISIGKKGVYLVANAGKVLKVIVD